jgi:hypothetical protein
MRILGYSERGALNSLLFETAYHPERLGILRRLLTCVQFASSNLLTEELTGATILLEQSLSDFGDADAILLLEHPGSKSALFLEAKVKSSTREAWTIRDEYEAFEFGWRATVNSSNLFAQLYSKARFSAAAKLGGIEQLQRGVAFPQCSRKAQRKIGSNPVVRRAVETILPYVNRVSFIGLVPEASTGVAAFVRDHLVPAAPPGFEGWDVAPWGFLSWHDVRDFCIREGLTNTLQVLEFNRGQVY